MSHLEQEYSGSQIPRKGVRIELKLFRPVPQTNSDESSVRVCDTVSYLPT